MINKADKIYSPNNLTDEEKPLKDFFEALKDEFCQKGYELWIRNLDYGRHIGAGIVDRKGDLEKAAIIWLKYGSKFIDNPLATKTIKEVREYLISATEEDCEFNKPIS